MFVYGVQFYREPNPPRHTRRRHLEQVASKLGFNTVKLWAMWNWCHPGPATYRLEELIELLEDCEELGLSVVLNTILENAPYWLEDRHPEARYRNAKGMEVDLRGRSNTPSGGWPGLCFHNEPVRQAMAAFLTELGEALSGYGCLIAWDCWNEPLIEPCRFAGLWANPDERLYCYCEASISAFRDWLQERYGDLDGLNAAWVRRFTDWHQVRPPGMHGTYVDWLDWRRFMCWSLSEHMSLRCQVLRNADPNHPIMSHGVSLGPLQVSYRDFTLTMADPWTLAEPLDLWGLSLFPSWFGDQMYTLAAKLDLIRSSARGKPFWLSELQAGHATRTGMRWTQAPRTEDIRVWNWLAVASGAEGILYWNYLPEATGIEATGFGLVQRDGTFTPRAEEARRACQLLQGLRDQHGAAEQEAVAILVDTDQSVLSFAMDGQDETVELAVLGFYRALWEADLGVRFVLDADLHALDLPVLMVPFSPVSDEAKCLAIRRYLERGGVVLIEAPFAWFDRRGIYQETQPGFGAHEWTGLLADEPVYVGRHRRVASDEVQESVPPIQLAWPSAGLSLQPSLYVAPLRVHADQVLATWQGATAAIRHQVGSGQLYYISTSVGISAYHGDDAARVFIRGVAESRATARLKGQILRPRLLDKAGTMIAVFNESGDEVQEDLAIEEKYLSARDLYTEEVLPVRARSLTIRVHAGDVRVIRLLESPQHA